MCGIAGIVSPYHDNSHIPPVALSPDYYLRGPDYHDTISLDNYIRFYHSKLGIVNSSHYTNQPFLDEKSGCMLTFNGEIFNHNELDSSLYPSAKYGDTGSLFTELILNGPNIISRLRGMFAFAFYSKSLNSLFLAVDSLSKKPLYYSTSNHKFAFASVPRDVLSLLSLPTQICPLQESLFLSTQFIDPSKSIFHGVYRLPPSTILRYDLNTLKVSTEFYSTTFDSTGSSLSDLLFSAISDRVCSSVPSCQLLSGGIDSSLIASFISRHQVTDIDAVTVHFPGYNDDEYQNALLFGSQYSINLQTLTLHPDLFCLRDILSCWHNHTQPIGDKSSIALHIIYKHLNHKGIRVAINGDGPDDLFYGYNKYLTLNEAYSAPNFSLPTNPQALYIYKYILGLKLPRFVVKKLLTSPIFNVLFSYSSFFNFPFSSSYISSQFSDPLFYEAPVTRSIDIRNYLISTLIHKSDLISMQHSVEARSPFLDERIINYSNDFYLSQSFDNILKQPIRALASEYLPSSISQMPKRGFRLPVQLWLSTFLSPVLEQSIDKTELLSPPIRKPVRNALLSYMNGNRNYSGRAWTAISYLNWLEYNLL